MFRREDYLHSGGVGCGSTSADGNESSPHPVYENGNVFDTVHVFMFMQLRSPPLPTPYAREPFRTDHNGPFAGGQSRGTKSPCWRARNVLGQDKQRKLPF